MKKLKRNKNLKVFKGIPKRIAYFNAALVLVVSLCIPILAPNHAGADLVESRSLDISSSARGDINVDANGTAVPAGSGGNGEKTRHTITFTFPAGSEDPTIGSMLIVYCTSPIFQTSCTTPTGFTATNLTDASVSVGGLSADDFSLDTTTTNGAINGTITGQGTCNAGAGTNPRNNCVALQRVSPTAETGFPTVTITYGGGASDYLTNPTSDNTTFYARLLIFSDTSYTTMTDYGGLAASTAQQVDITAKVQEVLRFSVGTDDAHGKGDNAQCLAYTDNGELTLGEALTGVLDPAQAYFNHSYFRINTNSVVNTIVYYSGDTLISGTNDIDPIGIVATASTPGTEQFGLGFDDDDTDHEFVDLVADDGTGPASHTTDYASADANPGPALFAFDTNSTTTPVEIARSSGGILCDTGAIRYVANISTSTPAGVYKTTITYIATATY